MTVVTGRCGPPTKLLTKLEEISSKLCVVSARGASCAITAEFGLAAVRAADSNRLAGAVLAVGELPATGKASPARSVLMPAWTFLAVEASMFCAEVDEDLKSGSNSGALETAMSWVLIEESEERVATFASAETLATVATAALGNWMPGSATTVVPFVFCKGWFNFATPARLTAVSKAFG